MGRTYENRKASMAKTGAMKTKLYSKYGKEIYVCAKNGGFDPIGIIDCYAKVVGSTDPAILGRIPRLRSRGGPIM